MPHVFSCTRYTNSDRKMKPSLSEAVCPLFSSTVALKTQIGDREPPCSLALLVHHRPREFRFPVGVIFIALVVVRPLTRLLHRVVMNIASIILIATDPSFVNGTYVLLCNNVISYEYPTH